MTTSYLAFCLPTRVHVIPLSVTVEAQVDPEAQVAGWVEPDTPPDAVNVQLGALFDVGAIMSPGL
jgi:hypothetical protein